MNAHHFSVGTVLTAVLTAVMAAMVLGAIGGGSVPLLGFGLALAVLGASVVGFAFHSGRGR